MELGNAINWFEIPVNDFARGKKFYETIFDYQMPEMAMGPVHMGFFLYDQQGGKAGGAICKSEMHVPCDKGSLVYLNCQPDLQIILDRVEAAGGKIVMPKTQISTEQDLGYWALMMDTEGNKVALHSMG